MKSHIKTFFASALLISALGTQSANATKLYKWIDDEGNISYQDSPPPTGSNIVKEEEIATPVTKAQPAATSGTTAPVTVYIVDNCESCDDLIQLLQSWNVPTRQQSLRDKEVQNRILEANESLQAPTLVIDDKFISNLSSSNIITELKAAGYQIAGSGSEESEPEEASN